MWNLLVERLRTLLKQWRFNALTRRWKKETCYMSSPWAIAQHPAYQEIIGMGKSAIPMILKAMQKEEDHWFVALNTITGEDPASGEDRFDEATHCWLQWGKKKGYLK